jgi:signal peptidase I
VVLAVVIFLLIRVAIQNYRIEGSSMEPNFHNGEYLLVNKLAYRLGEYQRGDVIVFKYPGDTTKDYIKRVIGLPGDTIEIREGMLYVNDQLVAEPYQVMPMNYLTEPPRVVESGTLYVMGDNRPASSDTRDWGLLDQELVIGQAWLAIYPFDTFGLVDHPDLHFTPGMAQGP